MKKNGFTLVELSIVLVIIGLLIGGSFKFLKTMRQRAKVSQSTKDVAGAKNTIIGYAMTTKMLPSKNEFTNNLSPIKGNQHQLLYIHDTSLELKNICSALSTALKIKVDDFNGSSHTIDDAAFIVVSESANMNMQTALSGNTVEIRKPYEDIDDEPTPVSKVEPYDDVSQWVTLAELQQNIGCAQNPLHIVNTSLPDTNVLNSTAYSANIIIDGNYSQPTNSNCNFNDIHFTYNNTTMHIGHDLTPSTAGTVSATCSVTADGKTVTKTFAITVNN